MDFRICGVLELTPRRYLGTTRLSVRFVTGFFQPQSCVAGSVSMCSSPVFPARPKPLLGQGLGPAPPYPSAACRCEAAQQPEEIPHPLQASVFYLQTGGDTLFTALSPGSREMMLWGPHQSLQNQDRGKQPICAGGTIVASLQDHTEGLSSVLPHHGILTLNKRAGEEKPSKGPV